MSRGALVVLLVEDDPGDVMMITEALEHRGDVRQTHVVGNGIEAMEFLRRRGRRSEAPRPDLVLLDLNMPKMDGRQTLAAIKSDQSLTSIPVIVLTTSNARSDIRFSYGNHANAYVVKPMNFDDLLGSVQQIDAFYGETVTLPPHPDEG